MRLVLGLVAVATLVAGSAALSAAPTRTIDRTFRCTPVVLSGGLRVVSFDAVPAGANEPYDPRQARSPGFIGVASGGRGPDAELVSIRARRWHRFAAAFTDEGVYASGTRCVRVRKAVPLSPRGLPGPAVKWALHENCVLPGRVLVRLRATLESAATWGPQQGAPSEGVRRNVFEAALAVRSERTGRPLAYLELERGGTTKLWYSRACVG